MSFRYKEWRRAAQGPLNEAALSHKAPTLTVRSEIGSRRRRQCSPIRPLIRWHEPRWAENHLFLGSRPERQDFEEHPPSRQLAARAFAERRPVGIRRGLRPP